MASPACRMPFKGRRTERMSVIALLIARQSSIRRRLSMIWCLRARLRNASRPPSQLEHVLHGRVALLQIVTKRGAEAAVLVPMDDSRRLQRSARPTLKELLLADAPRAELRLPTRGRRRRRTPNAIA